MEVLKVQTTLRGYNAWVIQRMMEMKREPLADTAGYVFNSWIENNPAFLLERGLSVADFHNEVDARDKVKQFDRKESS